MKTETLNNLVVKEAKNLKVNATKEELENLNFRNLNPSHIDNCIYGQMTGDCFSYRATDLIRKNCVKVYDSENGTNLARNKENELLGNPFEFGRGQFWSPIEIFIAKRKNENNGNNERLIKFLKGENKTLRFK